MGGKHYLIIEGERIKSKNTRIQCIKIYKINVTDHKCKRRE